MHSTKLHLLRAAIVCFAAAWLPAQTEPPLSPDRATFFTEPNFKGEALTVEAGAVVENLDRLLRASQQPWSLAISSVRLEGAARATVFSGPNFSGERLEVAQSIADLYSASRGREGNTWDRAIASLQVAAPARAAVAPPAAPVMVQPPRAAPVVVAPPPPQATVVVTQPPPPPTVVVVPATRPPPVVIREVRPRLDRRTADLIIQRAYRDVLNRPADPDGLRMYRERLINEGWSERQVIEALQRSKEARGVNADQAIAQAYHDVLGRDPDANGLAHYRAKWREGWTQGQIRDDLRRSQEGRGSYIQNVITKAYREVLGREPDPAGLANYEKAMRERGWTERDVRQALMSGDEYRQKHPRGR